MGAASFGYGNAGQALSRGQADLGARADAAFVPSRD